MSNLRFGGSCSWVPWFLLAFRGRKVASAFMIPPWCGQVRVFRFKNAWSCWRWMLEFGASEGDLVNCHCIISNISIAAEASLNTSKDSTENATSFCWPKFWWQGFNQIFPLKFCISQHKWEIYIPSRERSHIPPWKRKIIDSKVPAGRGYVSSFPGGYLFTWIVPPFLLLHDSSCRWLRLGKAGVTEKPGSNLYTFGSSSWWVFSPTLLKKDVGKSNWIISRLFGVKIKNALKPPPI